MNETARDTSLDLNKLLGFKRLLALPEMAAERRIALGLGFNKAGEVGFSKAGELPGVVANKVSEAEAPRAGWVAALGALASKAGEVI